MRDLITDITGQNTSNQPYFAAVTMSRHPPVRKLLALPQSNDGEMLIHDYQAMNFHMPLPTERPLNVDGTRDAKERRIEISLSISEGDTLHQTMTLALRRIGTQDLGNLKPVTLRNVDAIGDLTRSGIMHISQDQIDRYVALSGDVNPIHRDQRVAAELGLEAPLVPGMLLLALCQPFIERAGLKAASMRARFVAPLIVDEDFRVSVQSRGPDRARTYMYTRDARSVAIADLVLAPTAG